MTTLSTTPCHLHGLRRRQRGADQAADQRVRRRRGQPEVPGAEVPDDGADERREHDHQPGVRARAGGSMMPLPTVLATLVEMSAPTTLITAAIASATRGVRALVEIDVAIALAESWKPLVKSKPEGDDDDDHHEGSGVHRLRTP